MITKRIVVRNTRCLDQRDKTPYDEYRNELRPMHATRPENGDSLSFPDDLPDKDYAREANDASESTPKFIFARYGCQRGACQFIRQARENKKHRLLLMFGCNNTTEGVIKAAFDLEHHFEVDAIHSLVPANGARIEGKLNHPCYTHESRDAGEPFAEAGLPMPDSDQRIKQQHISNKSIEEFPGKGFTSRRTVQRTITHDGWPFQTVVDTCCSESMAARNRRAFSSLQLEVFHICA